MHPMAQRLIDEYLEAAGHRYDQKGPLFRPVKTISAIRLISRLIFRQSIPVLSRKYGKETGIMASLDGFRTILDT